MRREQIFALGILTSLIMSCSSGSEPDISPSPNPTPGSVTYTNTITSIINSSCISCHGAAPQNGATVSLNTYERVKLATQNNGLIDRISSTQGSAGMMPQGGTRLPQVSIDQFITWKNNVYPE